MPNTSLTNSTSVEQPKPHRPISLYVTPPLDIDDSNPTRGNSTSEEEDDEDDDVMDKHSCELSQLQFTPPSSLNNGKFMHMIRPITPPTNENNSPTSSTSPFKYHQPPSKKSLLKQGGYSTSESILLSPSKLFKRLSRKFSSSSGGSNESRRNSLIISSSIPNSVSTTTLKSVLELPTKDSQSPKNTEPASTKSSSAKPTTNTSSEKTTPKNETTEPENITMMSSPKSIVTRVKVSKSHPEKDIETTQLQQELTTIPANQSEQEDEEDHDEIITGIQDITSFSGFSLDRKASITNESHQKSTFSNDTPNTTMGSHSLQESQDHYYSPSPSSSKQTNNDPVSSTPISVTRNSTKKSNSSKLSRSHSSSKSSSNSEQVLVLRIFMRDPDTKEIISITIKLRKDKLRNINELTNLVLFKLMGKKQDLNINNVKLLIFFKNKNLKPILLKDSVNKKSKSLENALNKEFGSDKDDLLLDYVQMKDKLYIKASI